MQGQCYSSNTPSLPARPNAREERAVLENINGLEKAIAEMASFLTDLERRLDVARRHLPHPTTVDQKELDGSDLAKMIAAKTEIIGDLVYRMKNLLDELEI